MATFTMFSNNMIHIMGDQVTDLDYSQSILASQNYDDRDDTLYFETDRFLLNNLEIRRLVLPNFAQSESVSIILRVNGEVRIDILALDYNDSAPIKSSSNIFGNSRFPGILTMTTYNVLEMKIVGVSEFSLVESYASIIVQPDDARLLTS